MMVIDEQRKLGWFATDRYQPSGKVMIYTFIPNAEKTIVHSEDKEYLRKAAQLKTYHKITVQVSDGITDKANQMPESEKQIEFVVNDSIVYTNVNQFKSDVAVKLWTDYHNFSIELNRKIKELSDLRAKYAHSENDAERKVIAPKIIELEKINLEMKNQISVKINQIRSIEIDFLKKKK
jgi:hypothetical protein